MNNEFDDEILANLYSTFHRLSFRMIHVITIMQIGTKHEFKQCLK